METLLNRQAAIEERFHNKQSNRNAFALIESGWLCFKIAGDKSFLNKAYHTAVTMAKSNFSAVEFYFLQVFIHIEMENYESAAALLDGLKPYKGYYKNHEPWHYAYYLFLLSLYDQRTGKKRAAEKQYRALALLAENDGNPMFDLLLGILGNAFAEYEHTADCLSYAYDNGCRSVFLFYAAFDCFMNAPKTITRFDERLFFALTQWALRQGIDIGGLIQKFNNVIAGFYPRYLSAIEDIQEKYPSETLLQRICTELIGRMDYSARAFRYYKAAEATQLELPGLYAALINAASLHNDETIGRYAVENYLKSQTADRDLLAFVFHLIITQYRNTGLFAEYEAEIQALAAESLRNSQSGRYYNSLYTVYIEDRRADKELVERAEKRLYEDLFKFRLYLTEDTPASARHPKIRYVWIAEKEQKEARVYTMSGKSRVVMASGEGFTCRFLSEEKREFIDAPHRIVRLVENAGFALYQRFFDKGLSSAELLVALANHYMMDDTYPAEGLDVFKTTAANAFLSPSYRMTVTAAIGNYYAARGNYKMAARYYQDVDENGLSDRSVEQMLIAYTNGKEYDKAVKLIIKKAGCIADRHLFTALKQIAAISTYHKDIADVAYQLTLKSWYDKTLTGIVFRHYNGSLAEWQALSKVLAVLSVSEPALDDIILKNAIWTHVFDKGSQSVFWRMYEANPDNALIEEYAAFCAYEMIVKGTKPEYETIEILEKLFFHKKDRLTAYALSHVYIQYDITTFRSEEILTAAIQNCEKDRLIFPIFKAIKDKSRLSPYIESNQPFIYRGLPKRTIRLYYKTGGESGFKPRTMKYVRFGLYFASIPSFYGETITYYFSEEMETGSITTKQAQTENANMRLSEDKNNPFYAINNALIYEQLFKYDMVEAIITEKLKEKPRIKGWII